jgi:hypothetical protein
MAREEPNKMDLISCGFAKLSNLWRCPRSPARRQAEIQVKSPFKMRMVNDRGNSSLSDFVFFMCMCVYDQASMGCWQCMCMYIFLYSLLPKPATTVDGGGVVIAARHGCRRCRDGAVVDGPSQACTRTKRSRHVWSKPMWLR